eukprot:350255-Chlamydomonas_euryale.AAC.5
MTLSRHTHALPPRRRPAAGSTPATRSRGCRGSTNVQTRPLSTFRRRGGGVGRVGRCRPPSPPPPIAGAAAAAAVAAAELERRQARSAGK